MSAWASEYHLTLGQVVVDKKSNEKMATHQNTADLITVAAGDYILALKKNQKILLEEVESEFYDKKKD